MMKSLVKGNGVLLLHDDAASTGLLRGVGVVALVDLEEQVRIGKCWRVCYGYSQCPSGWEP
jgi:hypothetical protein